MTRAMRAVARHQDTNAVLEIYEWLEGKSSTWTIRKIKKWLRRSHPGCRVTFEEPQHLGK